MITEDEYLRAKKIVEEYEHDEYEARQREAEDLVNWMDEEDPDEPCPTCGEVNGMDNPCCPNYDPLSYKNCGYG